MENESRAYLNWVRNRITSIKDRLAELQPLQEELAELQQIEPIVAKHAGEGSQIQDAQDENRDYGSINIPVVLGYEGSEGPKRTEQAEKILAEMGRPSRIPDMLKYMISKGYIDPESRTSMYNSLNSAMNRSPKFKRIGKGVWWWADSVTTSAEMNGRRVP